MLTELPPPAESDDEDELHPPAESDDGERVPQAEDMTPFWRNPANVSIMNSAVRSYKPQFDADLDKLKEVFEALTDTAADGGPPKLEFDFDTATVGPVNV